MQLRPGRRAMLFRFCLLVATVAASLAFATAGHAEDPAAQQKFFDEHIQPLLASKCFECHSHQSGEANGTLVVDSRAGLMQGGTRGPAMVPGNPDASLIMKAVLYQDPELQMPPDNPLPAESIELLRQWIAAGAVDNRNNPHGKPGEATPAFDPATHWAYQPIRRPALPTAKIGTSDADPVDQFITARLQEQGLQPSPQADRATLVRRLYFDLWGLPPELETVRAFVQDPRSDAYEKLVERLLSAPQFGERWARYWMDVARYADTKGYVFQEDRNYPEAYRYRDWLIQAFNQDMPYRDFIRHQLAADLIDPQNQAGQIPALGFLTLGRRFLNNRQDIIDDRMDVTARGLMGMTLGCARCHDHKYDPITSKDYYALFGVFLNTDEPGGDPWPMRLTESSENRKSFVLIRGNPGNRGEETPRRFVSFLTPNGTEFNQGSGRLELADQIVSTDNPLTARVFVNRVWMRLMGASLVESPSDFGVRCRVPLHLDVMDTLAADFMHEGWSVKRLIRRVVLSSTYRQSSLARTDAAAKDPQNQYYWRMNRRRLDFEGLRDQILTVSGQMNPKLGGPSEKIEAPPFSNRRTLYAFIDRQNVPGIFRNFDVASSDAHSPQRLPTTVPQQGLFLLNSEWVSNLAAQLGSRFQSRVQGTNESGTGTDAQRDDAIHELFHTVLRREPSAEELGMAIEYLSSAGTQTQVYPGGTWLCGYGSFNPTAPSSEQKLQRFEVLPSFRENRWSGREGPPDPQLGWCILTQDGGHPGNDFEHCVVRRWVAARDGEISIRGKLEHKNEAGDGVRGTVLLNGVSTGNQWSSHHGEVDTGVASIGVKAGDFVDFVVDCVTGPNSDSYAWKIRIKYASGSRPTFDSVRDYPTAPPPAPMQAWGQLAQALLLTNEFTFID